MLAQVEEIPTYDDALVRLAATRPYREDALYDLPTDILLQTVRYGFRKLTAPTLPDNLGEKLLKGLAGSFEEGAQTDWRHEGESEEPFYEDWYEECAVEEQE